MNLRFNYPAACCIAMVSIACSVLIGCGPSDELSRAPLTGKVIYQGKPLEHGMVGLLPIDGTAGPQGSAMIAPDGTYKIVTANKPGAVVGAHKVIVQCREKVSDEEMRQMKIGELLIPSEYATYDSTPLKVNVPSEGIVYNINIAD